MPRYSQVEPTCLPFKPPCVTVASHIVFESVVGYNAAASPPPPSPTVEACPPSPLLLLHPAATATPRTAKSGLRTATDNRTFSPSPIVFFSSGEAISRQDAPSTRSTDEDAMGTAM